MNMDPTSTWPPVRLLGRPFLSPAIIARRVCCRVDGNLRRILTVMYKCELSMNIDCGYAHPAICHCVLCIVFCLPLVSKLDWTDRVGRRVRRYDLFDTLFLEILFFSFSLVVSTPSFLGWIGLD
jgi:hypothetical protein